MTTKQFQQAFEIAKSSGSLINHDISVFDGFAISSFVSVVVTIDQVARLIRYQALMLNGQWDNDALTEILKSGRRKFTVVGDKHE